MMPRNDDWSPDPKQLDAYVDGEMTDDPALRLRIRHWLAVHPGAETPQALTELMRATRPDDPGEHVWAAMRVRLDTGMGSLPPAEPVRRLRPWIWGVAVAACAAAILLAVAFWPRRVVEVNPLIQAQNAVIPDHPNLEKNLPEVEVFAVASADEIEVLRVEGSDLGSLALVHTPLREPLVLAGPGDVTFNRVQPAALDNMIPEVQNQGPPMVWVPAPKRNE